MVLNIVHIYMSLVCRYAIRQAQAGRVVMSVDCTDLLNRRHFEPLQLKDSLYLTEYPFDALSERSFDEITVYNHYFNSDKAKRGKGLSITIVTYGNGVPTCALAVAEYIKTISSSDSIIDSISVVDCPYLTSPPSDLKKFASDLGKNDRLLFADICKEGPGMPFAGMAAIMQNEGLLDCPWRAVGAQATYNPLGNTITFLSAEDVKRGIELLVSKKL